MNIAQNPELVERLAASYALGTLRGGARRRFEAMARASVTVRAQALVWQERVAALNELQAPSPPSPNVWKRIDNTLDAERALAVARASTQAPALASTQASTQASALGHPFGRVGSVGSGGSFGSDGSATNAAVAATRRALNWWRGAAVSAALAAVLAFWVLPGQTPAHIEYVAVLADEQSAASLLVTFDPANKRLVLKRVGRYQEAADKSLQLWALPAPGAGAPRSLGVLAGDQLQRLTAVGAHINDAPALAISLEPKGGVPAGQGPSGPILFKGALIKTTL